MTKSVDAIFETLNFNWADFTLETFVAHVETLRNRSIELVGVPHLDVPMCLKVGDSDFIYYPNTLTASKQIHDILHELSHILLGHIDKEQDSERGIALHLDLRLRAYRSKTLDGVDLEQERDAEYLAYLIQLEISENNRLISLITLDESSKHYHIPIFSGKYRK